MKFDVIGRINNMRLPDGKTALLYSVYEAVSNSIHAINDRFSEEKAASKGEVWPAPGSEDTELGVFMGPEVSHGETQVYTGV